ncbi:tetratricopeptide repeat protein [Acinetobacter faecalis]|uniref:tetratricopeptide repeat protein n=1 Tax=Acinetobacter faecalis TaxID=2665161 RepID=UPI002A911718|nr:tetratricopeptide repeat protein [Acinetobacter faecalis]MDY6531083.1 tetratricopeptide repeat protein [Acinetobacter faecalis]
MKKILLASLIAVSSQFALADNAPQVDPAFAKIETLVKAKNFNEAYKELDKLAQTGNAQAIYDLGFLTQAGQGTTKNDAKALELFKQSADKGYPTANYLLGKTYISGGLGVKPDQKTAINYLEKAAKQGIEEANVDLDALYLGENKDASTKKALKLLDPLVKKGNPQALHLRALYDINTGMKEKKDASVKTGLDSIQALAQKGYVPALMEVGNILATGKLVKQNLPEAKKIFGMLAEKNIPHAKEALDAVTNLMAQQAKAPASTAKKG